MSVRTQRTGLIPVLLACTGIAAAGLPAAKADPIPVPAAQGQDWRPAVVQFAREHFKHPAWGFSHCERDYALAARLAAADHVRLNDDVLFAAAYLHDMAAFAPWEDAKLDHADVAADRVVEILKATNFPAAKIETVRGAIRTHMYDRDPQGPEALYLHDADALDWLGAIGVARILALIDPNGGEPTGPKAVAMLDENLAKVPSRVLSPAGKALVPARRQELQRFLAELRGESKALETL